MLRLPLRRTTIRSRWGSSPSIRSFWRSHIVFVARGITSGTVKPRFTFTDFTYTPMGIFLSRGVQRLPFDVPRAFRRPTVGSDHVARYGRQPAALRKRLPSFRMERRITWHPKRAGVQQKAFGQAIDHGATIRFDHRSRTPQPIIQNFCLCEVVASTE